MNLEYTQMQSNLFYLKNNFTLETLMSWGFISQLLLVLLVIGTAFLAEYLIRKRLSLKYIVDNNKKIEDLLLGLSLLPQFNKNINIENKKISQSLIDATNDKASEMLDDGRLIIRMSGTEPIIRVTIESTNKDSFKTIFNFITQELHTNE